MESESSESEEEEVNLIIIQNLRRPYYIQLCTETRRILYSRFSRAS